MAVQAIDQSIKLEELTLCETMLGTNILGTEWLPFLDTYRTMCLAPEPAFKRILEDVRDLRFAA
jgi:hypothetical protein